MTEQERERFERFIAASEWHEAKWAREGPAAHQYLMPFAADRDQYDWVVKLIAREGYKARWTHPDHGRSYSNVYLEADDGYTYWHIVWRGGRCLNREHEDVPTLRRPRSKAEAEAQGRLL